MNVRLRWLLLAFAVLAVTYGVVTPIFEAPDEVQHFFYARHVAQTGTLPVQDPAQPGLYRQEGSQPPLYYLLGAALTGWIDTRDAPAAIRENPHVNLGVPQAFGNKNAVVHDPATEGFPYHGVALAVHLLRGLSALFGVWAVWATWALAREAFPDRPGVAVLAAAANAFLPQFLFLSGAVNNDVAVAATSAWAMVVALRGLRLGFDAKRSLALGALLGLAALSKLSGLAVLPVAAVALWAWGRRERRMGQALRYGALVFGAAALVGGWWYARNWALYGDPFGLRTMLDVAGRRDVFGWADFRFELEGLRLSLWGVFGWFNVLMAQWAYRLFDALAALGVLGWVVVLVRRALVSGRTGGQPHRAAPTSVRVGATRCGRPRTQTTRAPAILALWVAVVLVALVRWTWSTTGSQGRLLFAALPGLCVLWAAGFAALWPGRVAGLRQWAVWGVTAVLAVVAASAPFLYIEPAYARPPTLTEQSLPAGLQRVEATFGGRMRLLGYVMPERQARRGTPLRVTLYWQALAAMDRDYTVFVHLFGRDGQAVGQTDTYPAGGAFPTAQWRAGEVVSDAYEVLIAPESRAPSMGRIDVGVYDLETRGRLDAVDREGRPLSQVMLAPFRIATWAAPQYKIDHPVRYGVGPDVALVGYRLQPETAPLTETLKVALYWQAQRAVPEDYTVFVHLVDATGAIVAQHDGPPVGGDYPTSFWAGGETVKDEHELALPAHLPAVDLHLELGLYRPADGARLPVTDESGQAVGDTVKLPKS